MLIVYLSLFGMVFLWGFSFVIVDIALEFIPPLSIALYRFIVASIGFILIDLYLKLIKKDKNNEKTTLKEDQKFAKQDWIIIFFASLTGASVFFLAQYNAIQLIGPSLPALFVCLLVPVIIAILSLILYDEKLNKIKIIGFIIATLGAFLLITGGDLANLTPQSQSFVGYIWALLTPILWATYSIITKKVSMSKKNTELKLIKYICYLGCIELFIFVVINGELIIFFENFLNITLFLCGIYLGIGCYIIGYYIWQKSQSDLKSSNVASFLYIEPFLTLLLSFIFQRSETIVLWNILGGVIVLIAVLIINYKRES